MTGTAQSINGVTVEEFTWLIDGTQTKGCPAYVSNHGRSPSRKVVLPWSLVYGELSVVSAEAPVELVQWSG